MAGQYLGPLAGVLLLIILGVIIYLIKAWTDKEDEKAGNEGETPT